MEESLREGAARLAWETGAPLVPATITGAFRAWPHYPVAAAPRAHPRALPRPIDPAPYRALPEEEALPALLAELRRRVEKSLLPGREGGPAHDRCCTGMPAPWPRTYEVLPAVAAATLVFWKTQSFAAVLPAYIFLAYLFLDRFLVPPSWLAKVPAPGGAAASSPSRSCRWCCPRWGCPSRPRAKRSWAIVVLARLFPYLYERTRRSRWASCQGLVLAAGGRSGRPAARAQRRRRARWRCPRSWRRTPGSGARCSSPYTVPILAAYAVGAVAPARPVSARARPRAGRAAWPGRSWRSCRGAAARHPPRPRRTTGPGAALQ